MLKNLNELELKKISLFINNKKGDKRMRID